MADKKPIIIKKVVKGGHGGHHGGAWKIAYSDFVTAMMAFFLLMWLLSNTSEETKEQLSVYFQEYSVFTGPPQSILGAPGASGAPSPGSEAPVVQFQEVTMTGAVGMTEGKSQEEILKEAMTKMIEERLEAYKDQLMVDTFESGVRIQMLYDAGHPFFDSGSSKLTAQGRDVLKTLSQTIIDLPNKLAVEGHTDSVPLGGGNVRYTNWELSTERASSARLVLEEFGLNPARIVRVTGYASTQPLDTEHPESPKNRRVSILLFNEAGSKAAVSNATSRTAAPGSAAPSHTSAPPRSASPVGPAKH